MTENIIICDVQDCKFNIDGECTAGEITVSSQKICKTCDIPKDSV